MNFANRYELSESITTGAVETFPARDALSGERVLIYVFESARSQPANVPTIEWVLEAFNRIAPAPKEIVINAGRYAGTAFLYLVTRMPASDALNQWIEAYQRYGCEPPKSAAARKAENRDSRASQPGLEGKKPVTSAFPAPGSGVESVTGGPQHTAPAEAFELRTRDTSFQGRTQGGSFAGLFLAGSKESTEASKAAETSRQMNPDLPGTGRDPFLTLPDSVAPRERAMGEFTRFFKGPFRGEASPDTPENLRPTPLPKPTTGEFTRLFGPVEKASYEAGSEPQPRIQPENLSLTQMLSEAPRVRTDPGTPPPSGAPPAAFGPISATPAQADAPARSLSSARVVPPPTPVFQSDPAPIPASEAPPPSSAPATAGFNKENATQLFSYSGSGRAQEPMLPPGPSEYTRVISRASIPPAESPLEPPIIGGAGAVKPVPVLPAAAPFPPPPPRVPPMAPFASMPAIAPVPSMPAMPAPPRLPQAPPEAKPVSYWPLILVMTVMFFLAVLLVMYFALKH